LNHFQLGGLVLGTSSRNENFDWKYGIYYNGELFGPIVVPLFGFNWKMNDKWRLKLIVPINAEISYQAADRFRTGLRFDGVNASYAYRSVPGAANTAGYIDKADNNVWAFGEFHLGKNVWFHLKAGYSIIRKYRYFVKGDKMKLKLGPVNVSDNRFGGNSKLIPPFFNDGWSFETRIIYRLPL
jgi:Domain of unknown function (DUF6268)